MIKWIFECLIENILQEKLLKEEGIHIRRAVLEDVDELTGLRIELLKEMGNLQREGDASTLIEATKRYFTEKIPAGDFISYIAEVDDRIVGISGMVLFERPPVAYNLTGKEGYVLNMYTAPDCRNSGIATLLLGEIISFAKSSSITRLWLHSTSKGMGIYKRFCFVPISERDKTAANIEMELVL
jgi:GNAT superfamily N-acetyltransferase